MAYNVGEIYEIFDKLDIDDKRKILKDLQVMLEVAEAEPELRGLEKDWDEIQKNIWSLSREPYIDDQWEIEEVWNITEKLLKSKYFKKEPWKLRKKILADIIENEFYDYYGVIDPMMDLFKALCFTDEEKLEFADMTFSFGSEWMKSYGAVLYRESGRPKKYYDYLEKGLGRDQQPYVELIEYYKDKDPDKAAKIATLGMEKCKDHQTECCIYLMQKAKAEKDEAQFEKLLKSARLRMSIDYEKVASSFGIESNTKRAVAKRRSK